MFKIKNIFYIKVNNCLILVIRIFNKLHLKIVEKLGNESIDNPNKYEVLSPKDNAPIDGYSEMLQIALQTSGTNNIAVTGTYGSGKSSFLRTFEKNHVEWNYLHISLATFEETKNKSITTEPIDVGDKTSIINKENQHKLIERSILQQIFYKEKDKIIPFSRFKRIINIKNKFLMLHTILLSLLILYSLSIFYPAKVQEFINYDLNLRLKEYYWLFFIAISISIYYLYKIIQYSTKLKVNKFNLKNGELHVGGKDNSSILNEHLDEILYFFEVTSYDVVVIEDLDRFDSTEIFIKLRELNTLINNSKDVNRKVKFVYAIKDDMFKDKDRTKFFEFIVPIIPYINSTSSYLKLKEKFKEENISEDFLRNVSLRINDMRLLLNISNEYKIYKHKINSRNINQERLLAMIIYKNFYPEDFAKLHINEGEVFETFSNKTKYINIKIDELSEKIKKKDEEINEYEIKIKVEKSKSIEELRKIYIFKIFEKVNNNNFYIEGKQYLLSNIDKLIKDDEFKVIKGGIVTNNYGSKITSFEDLENKVNEEFTYTQREEIILNQKNKNLEKLKQDLQELKDKQNEIKKYTISEIAKYDSSEIFKNIGSKNLLQFLLRDGYIREDEYHNYISYFFEGGLTKKDREFVLSVKDNKPFNFEYELINKKEVINHLAPRDFEVKAILNYSLLEYMFEKNIKNDKFDNFITVLINNEDSRNFIFDYINFGKNLKKFIDII
ncbi:YobI family P-loop NTPase, partial [Aliarcobacter skirrowii]